MKKTVDLTRTALMAVVISVCAWISVPSVIPFTLQTFGIFLTMKLIGGKNGTLAVLLYVILGTVGLPVFSGFSSGLGCIIGPTGGYITGFIILSLIYWLFEKKMTGRIMEDIVLTGGLAACYLFGTVWFYLYMNRNGTDISFLKALGMCVLPYIIPDMLKLLIADLIAGRIKKHTDKDTTD